MSDKSRTNIVLIAVALYCALSWVLMRSDYFAHGGRTPVTEHFAHLLFTAVLVLGIALWKGRSIESFIARMSLLPNRDAIAIFVIFVALAFSMMDYPRNRPSVTLLSLGLMESTRSLVERMFLAGAAVALAGIITLNARALADSVRNTGERILLQPPRARFLLAAALLMFIETNAISWLQFHHVPVCSDEVCYLFQAKVFAEGRLWADPPKYPEFISFVSFIVTDSKWYSIVAPGFPLVLVPGVLVGAPWIVNPTLAALSVALVFLVARRMFDERTARIAAALYLVSPFFLLLSSVHLSHTATAFFFLLFLLLFLKGLDRGGWYRFALAGAALGGMMATRPLTGLAASVPWALYTLWLLASRKLRLANAALMAIGVAVPMTLVLAYNNATTGDPFTFGYTALYGTDFRLGFVQGPPELSFIRFKHTPLRGLINLNNGFSSLNSYLFGWPIPSLVFAMVPFATSSRNKWDYLLLAHLLSIPALYFFFIHQDFFMGPRYYFSVIPAALILTARGLTLAPELWHRLGGSNDERKAASFLATLMLICIAFNAAWFFPERLRFYHISSPIHQGVTAPLWRHLDPDKIKNAVIFINDFPFSLAYGTGLWRNDPDLSGNIIYVRDLGQHNIKMMEIYPGRKYYRYMAVTNTFEEFDPIALTSGPTCPPSIGSNP